MVVDIASGADQTAAVMNTRSSFAYVYFANTETVGAIDG
jgi:hypothetical protein